LPELQVEITGILIKVCPLCLSSKGHRKIESRTNEMKRLLSKVLIPLFALAIISSTQVVSAASIFLTGHDPDFHASNAAGTAVDSIGAVHINQVAINYILDPTFNLIADGGVSKFLFVESKIAPPGVAPPSGHRVGKNGIIRSGYVEGVDFEHHDATTLNTALNDLGTTYAGIVVASDFGGLLTQAELDILNARSTDIINFLNIDNGGLYAMAEGNSGTGLTPDGGWFGYLPFVASTTGLNQSEAGTTVTLFGAALGLTNTDVSSNFSHNIFDDTFGLDIVDVDSAGNILTLAGRGVIDPGTGLNPVPVPAAVWLFGTALIGFVGMSRRRKVS
jgi:hypothetical protein